MCIIVVAGIDYDCWYVGIGYQYGFLVFVDAIAILAGNMHIPTLAQWGTLQFSVVLPPLVDQEPTIS